MLRFSPSVLICTNGQEPTWHANQTGWLREYDISVRLERVTMVEHKNGQLQNLTFERHDRLPIDAIFTTRGDVYHTALAQSAGAALDAEGQIIVDHCLRTSVPGLYAAGCITAANCQMIIAAGQGAIAAQAINRDLFEESLNRHTLLTGQLGCARTR